MNNNPSIEFLDKFNRQLLAIKKFKDTEKEQCQVSLNNLELALENNKNLLDTAVYDKCLEDVNAEKVLLNGDITIYPAAKKINNSKLVRNLVAIGTAIAIGVGIGSLLNKKEKAVDTMDLVSNNDIVTEFITENNIDIVQAQEFAKSVKEEGYDVTANEIVATLPFTFDNQDAADLYADQISSVYPNANSTLLKIANELAKNGNIADFSILFDGEDKIFLEDIEEILTEYVNAYKENDTKTMTELSGEYSHAIYTKLGYSITPENAEVATVLALQAHIINSHFGLEIKEEVLRNFTNTDGTKCGNEADLFNVASGFNTRINEKQLEASVMNSIQEGFLEELDNKTHSQILREEIAKKIQITLDNTELGLFEAIQNGIISESGKINSDATIGETIESLNQSSAGETYNPSVDGPLENIVNPETGKDQTVTVRPGDTQVEVGTVGNSSQTGTGSEYDPNKGPAVEVKPTDVPAPTVPPVVETQPTIAPTEEPPIVETVPTPVPVPTVPPVGADGGTPEYLTPEEAADAEKEAIENAKPTSYSDYIFEDGTAAMTFSSDGTPTIYISEVTDVEVPVTDTNSVVIEQDVTLTKGN